MLEIANLIKICFEFVILVTKSNFIALMQGKNLFVKKFWKSSRKMEAKKAQAIRFELKL